MSKPPSRYNIAYNIGAVLLPFVLCSAYLLYSFPITSARWFFGSSLFAVGFLVPVLCGAGLLMRIPMPLAKRTVLVGLYLLIMSMVLFGYTFWFMEAVFNLKT